jgi:hypothetical protein
LVFFTLFLLCFFFPWNCKASWLEAMFFVFLFWPPIEIMNIVGSRVSPSLVYVISYWSNLEIFSDQPVHCTQIIKKFALFRYEITRKMVAFHINYHLLFGSWLWTSMFTVFLFFLLEIWIILCTEIFKKSRLTLTWLLSACLPSLSPLIDLIYEHFLLQ